MSEKVAAVGGDVGGEFDHGAYTGVRMVYITSSSAGISHIMVNYDKAGKVVMLQNGNLYEENRFQGQQNEFVLDYPYEYITSVKGTCDLESGLTNRVRSLSFKTSKERTSPTYGKVGNQTFVLESKGRALVGFHGRAGLAIDAIGAYFGPPPMEKLQAKGADGGASWDDGAFNSVGQGESSAAPRPHPVFSLPSGPVPAPTLSPIQLEYQGGSGGNQWDHGVYTGVRKVYLTCSPSGISHIMVDYDKAGKMFVLDYPYEYITSVKGTCDLESGLTNRVRSLSFKTSKERTSPTYGKVGNQTFVLESKGRALVGFHGRAGWAIDAIGAYFSPPPIERLQAKGADVGASWDDGAYDGVRKIYVGQGENGVSSVKFVYDKNNQVVLGEDHGNRTMFGYEEFELEYPNEYITAVEGCYRKLIGSESTVITMLKFKTNIRTSPAFGFGSSSSFVLEKKGHKIVGFHGMSSHHELHRFGISVAPLVLYKLRGNNIENPHLSDCLKVALHRIDGYSPEIENVFSDDKPFRTLLGKLKFFFNVGTEVLADVEQGAYGNQGINNDWIAKFQDASFHAENILEYISEVIVLIGQDVFPGNISYWFKWNPKDDLYSLLIRMEGIVEELKCILDQMDELGLRDRGRAGNALWHPRSGMGPLIHLYNYKYIGREADKLAFTNLLVSKDRVSYGTPNVISVNGMPGIGKTTLVAVVYDEDSITKHFDHKVWIHVGQDFDVFRVTKDVLHEITSAAANTEDLPSLQVQLMKTLAGKRFLLVLDDFWSESSSEWQLFLTAFIGGSEGSKIVLTTQNDNVSSATLAARTYHLRLMTNKECYKLICSSVFGDKTMSSVDQKLERVGQKIADQCNGLPLAATSIASHLQSKLEIRTWSAVSQDFLSYTTGVLEVLRRSYDSLPCHLKRCFAFCSIFPKGYEFDRKNLVLLWMANDLLYQPGSNQRLEDIGNKYLDDLVARYFLQSLDTKKKFTMHDFMNDLAKSTAGDFCYRVQGILKRVPTRVRHLSVSANKRDFDTASTITRHAKYLRTFLFFRPTHFESRELAVTAVDSLPDFSEEALRCLRILSLSHYHITTFPESFKGLKQLRYLDLSNTEVEEIPEFVFSLRNLQTLFLTNCRQLRRLTAHIVHLINLRYLILLRTPLVEMPRGIRNLTSLQNLSNFVIGNLSGAALGELRGLSHLGGTLHISELQNAVSFVEASDPGLMKKPLLKELALTWSEESSSSNTTASGQSNVLEMMEPHPNLEKVSIKSYGGATFPDWLGNTSFISMTSVTLSSCSLCISLPPLGQLPYLRYLSIEDFKILQKVGLEFFYSKNEIVSPLESFPSLLNLSFYDMPRWEEWHCSELDGSIFPRLNKLTIRSCPSLKGIPKGLPDFTQVTINDSPLSYEKDRGKISEPSLSKKEELNEENKELYRQEPESSSEIYEEIAVASNPSLSKKEELHEESKDLYRQEPESSSEIYEEIAVASTPSLSKKEELHEESKDLYRQEPESSSEIYEEIAVASKPYQKHLSSNLLTLSSDVGSTSGKIMPQRNQDEMGFESSKVTKIPELRKLSASLERLHVEGIRGLISLPESLTEDCPDLQELVVVDCHFLEDFHGEYITLKTLYIRDCMKLELIERLETMHKFPQLEDLFIDSSCSYLSSFPLASLPNLKSLTINNCEQLRCFTVSFARDDICLALETLEITDCPKLEFFAEGGLRTLKLASLLISNCKILKVLPADMSTLTSLQSIHINECPGLEGIPSGGFPESLQTLCISCCQNLRPTVEWGLYNLGNFRNLEIDEKNEDIESFPDKGLLPRGLYSLRISEFKNLKTLNHKGLEDLPTLGILEISGCDKLESFPDEGLPSSLSLLRINDSPKLKEKIYRKDFEWFKIKHIKVVVIDGEELLRGRKNTEYLRTQLKLK